MNGRHPGSIGTILPIVLISIGVLLIVGTGIWLFLLKQPETPAAVTAQENIPYPEAKRVSLEQAKTAFDQKSAVFVDVRAAADYQQGHIPGAINIPLDTLDSFTSEINPGQWIITYCT